MIAKSLFCSVLLLQTTLTVKGCSNCECDEGGALSSCQVPQCKPNHDLLIEETS
ncbi:unnamed protein product [Porites evermanni]|uniref:Uncharacterized protein n=1 Tax=Porites evermanni TaxID=104178 RepID=A0ABN8SQQ9_9CNID|nr:unnamed protein product [Porites evermanni]